MRRVYAHAPDRVKVLVGASPVPASGVPFVEQITARAAVLLNAVAERGSCDLPVEVTDDFRLADLVELLVVPA